MTISERMFDLLKNTPDKSPAGLCRLLGCGTGLTSGWKKRNADPPAKYLVAIADYLGVSVMYLLTGLDDEQKQEQALTDDEDRLLSKYRSLDEDGKDAVRGVLLNEQRRVESEKGLAPTA